MVNPFEPKKYGTGARPSVAGQNCWATPISRTNRPIVTTRLTPTGASPSPRIITRSSTMPSSGAITNSTSTTASNVGMCSCTVSCQYTKAMTMLIAPWPRLNTRVVVYVSTRPDAAIA
jgi:hypothetical protein